MVLGYQALVNGQPEDCQDSRRLNENDNENVDFLLFVRFVRFVVEKNSYAVR